VIYLDSAATSLMRPNCVKEAVIKALDSFGNPSRSAHSASLSATRTVTECRMELADLFHLENPSSVIFTPNATFSLNIAIQSLEGHIITTQADHNSTLRPIYRKGNYSILPCDSNGDLLYNQLAAYLKPDTCAIVMTHASNVTGTIYDLKRVGEFCLKHKLLFIVDGSQTAGLLPIHMKEYHISALCITGHKSLLGPQGTGALLLNEDFIPHPVIIGGSGIHSFEKYQPKECPECLEAGTVNSHGIAGLLAGLKYLKHLPASQPLHQALELADNFYKGIISLSGIKIYGHWNKSTHVPVISLNLEGTDPAQLAFLLSSEYDIAVRAGYHCAPLMHQALGTEAEGCVRFSFSHLNTSEEISLAISALKSLST
jgi:cysteine desulfurase family protein